MRLGRHCGRQPLVTPILLLDLMLIRRRLISRSPLGWGRGRWTIALNLIAESTRIRSVDGIISDIGVKIQVVLIPDRIGLHESPDGRIIHPSLVVVEADLRDVSLSGKLKASLIRRTPKAIGVVLINGQGFTVAVGHIDEYQRFFDQHAGQLSLLPDPPVQPQPQESTR